MSETTGRCTDHGVRVIHGAAIGTVFVESQERSMTDEEINDRVAREVMGWTLRECGDSLDWFNGDEYQCGRYDFSPATEARHAMEVATKCRLSLLINSDVDKPMWQARRWVTMRDETASKWCESPCRAICLAALAAKGGG